jgi:hypothetical protein
MTALIIISVIIVITVAYLTFIVKKFGIQPSISNSMRVMQEKWGKGSLKPWLFWAYLASMGGLFFSLITTGWGFAAMFGLSLCGAAARFWENKSTEVAHNAGAMGGIALAFTALAATYGWWYLIPIAVQGLAMWIMKKKNVNNYTWWIETSSIILIVLSLIIQNLIILL